MARDIPGAKGTPRGVQRVLNLMKLPARSAPPVGATPADVVHRENKLRLLRYRARDAGLVCTTPVLLVPSLINRHYVLDLMPGKSMAEWLVAEGFDVWTIDWGTPAPEDRYLGFDDIVDGYLGRCVRTAARVAGVPGVHLLGYCMGGIFTAIYAARHPQRVASLVQLAAPVRFDDEGILAKWTSEPGFDAEAVVAATGNVPWQLLQGAFHMLRPTLNLSKSVHLVDRAWNDAFLDGYLAMETWANDNVSLPGAFYARYINDVYRDNQLVRGELSVAGSPVDLSNIVSPVLAVVFTHDHIAPAESCAALLDHVSSGTVERLDRAGGHVGGVVSSRARRELWPKLASWWQAHAL